MPTVWFAGRRAPPGIVETTLSNRTLNATLACRGRLYYDTANATHPAAMAALLTLADPAHVVFGSDYPYVAMKPQLTALAALGLPEDTARSIVGGSARSLLEIGRRR